MELIMIPVAKIKEHELNPRETIETEYDRLVSDIKENYQQGFIKSAVLVVKQGDDYQLLDGHHRLRAFKEVGVKECPGIVLTQDEYDEGEQLASLITMNQQVASFDAYKLSDVLSKLKDMGWSTQEIEEKLSYEAGEIDKMIEITSKEIAEFDEYERDNNDKDKSMSDQMPDVDDEYGSKMLEFELTDEQVMLVEQGISKVLDEEKVSNGRALELICADYQAGA